MCKLVGCTQLNECRELWKSSRLPQKVVFSWLAWHNYPEIIIIGILYLRKAHSPRKLFVWHVSEFPCGLALSILPRETSWCPYCTVSLSASWNCSLYRYEVCWGACGRATPSPSHARTCTCCSARPPSPSPASLSSAAPPTTRSRHVTAAATRHDVLTWTHRASTCGHVKRIHKHSSI